ncbi:MAG: amidase [Burkholderiales bacterium]|nr:amidase [Burkholderiales bacterium]
MITSFPFGSASAQAAALRRGQVGSVELLKAYLARVDRHNPALNAFVVDDRKAAFRQARAADQARARGEILGPLHGLPMTVKESFDLTGHPTTWGNLPRKSHVATADALAVKRLKAAGAVVFGKTNVPLNLADFQSYNAVYGRTNNPWDVQRVPGGSSGGSAAMVAAGLSALEFGSDIGGSIRNPAAYCGVYGHKPTWCIVPKRGHALTSLPVAEADLSVIGPLARSAGDLALALKLTAGPDVLTARGLQYRLPAAPRQVKGLRIAVWLDEPAIAPVDDAVKQRIEAAARALAKAGARVDLKARPAVDPLQAHCTYLMLLQANMAARRPDMADLLAARGRLRDDDQSEHAMTLRASTASFKEVFDANHRREQLRWAWHDFFGKYDAMLMPITATPAFAHDPTEPMAARRMRINGADHPYFSQLFWAGLATAPYLPSTVAPVGLSPAGLPVGLQIVGPEFADLATIWLAGELGKLIGGYQPPPGY